MLNPTELHFPPGLPRRRLHRREPCVLSGQMMTGLECLAGGCPYAIEAECGGFVDCTALELTPVRRAEARAACRACDRKRRKAGKERPGA